MKTHRFNLRKSTPRKRSQANGHNQRNNATNWMQQIGGHQHENGLAQKGTTIEVTSHLRRRQPTLDLAQIGQITGHYQQNAHGQVRSGRQETGIFQIVVQRICWI